MIRKRIITTFVNKGGVMKKARQRLFCQEYLLDLSATQAAIRAGYSPKTARSQGQRLLTKPDVRKAIDEAQKVRQVRTQISADYVLNSLKEVAERCMQAEPVIDKDGKSPGIYRFDSAGVNRALELLGKHLKMFTDRIEIRVIKVWDVLSEDEKQAIAEDLRLKVGETGG